MDQLDEGGDLNTARRYYASRNQTAAYAVEVDS